METIQADQVGSSSSITNGVASMGRCRGRRGRTTWFWLLNENESTESTESNTASEDSKMETIQADQVGSSSSITNSVATMGQARTSWFWLLNEDGSFAMDVTESSTASEDPGRHVKEEATESKEEGGAKAEPSASTESRSTDLPTPDPVSSISNSDTGQQHRNTQESRMVRWWHWLLEPDGSHATEESTPPTRSRKRRRKREAGDERSSEMNITRKARRKTEPAKDEENPKVEANPVGSRPQSSRRGRFTGSYHDAEDSDSDSDSDAVGSETQSDEEDSDSDAEDSDSGAGGSETHSDSEDSDGDAASDKDESACTTRFSSSQSQRHHAQWEEKFQLLRAHQQKHKTANPPQRTPIIGNWSQRQRRAFKNGKLSKEQIARLESIGFEWQPKEDKWTEMYERLVVHQKKHKNTLVPWRWKEDPRLAMWVNHQRDGKDSLGKGQIDLLNKIGFVWSVHGKNWMEMHKQLVAHKKKHKNTLVPKKWKEDPRLANWVVNQRRCKDSLGKDRIDLLNNVGFVWKVRDQNWMKMCERLVACKKKHNNTLVPWEWKEDLPLGRWVCTQRRRKDSLGKDQIDLLNEIGFVWKVLDQNWMEMYERLVAYTKKHDNTLVPKTWKEDPRLGAWVQKQRRRKSSMKKDRIDLLDDIGFVWNATKGL